MAYHSNYEIPGTLNLDGHRVYQDPSNYPRFNESLAQFKNLLRVSVDGGQALSVTKFGDGDYYFLKGKSVGSAKPGNRAISRRTSIPERKRLKKILATSDILATELYPENIKRLQEVTKRKPDYPSEFIYGLVANKWLLQTFSGETALIGASEKLEIIGTLLSRNDYQDYLGIDSFVDLIPIPQRFAADSPEKLFETIRPKVETSKAKLFLLGIGSVKTMLVPKLATIKDAVFLDIGSGMDALAGIVDTQRPFFGAWTNYQLRHREPYEALDLLQFNGENIRFID